MTISTAPATRWSGTIQDRALVLAAMNQLSPTDVATNGILADKFPIPEDAQDVKRQVDLEAITYYTDRPIVNFKQMATRDERFRPLRADAEARGYRFWALLHDTEALELGPAMEGRWHLRGKHGPWITLWELEPLRGS